MNTIAGYIQSVAEDGTAGKRKFSYALSQKNCKKYVEAISNWTGVPVKFISVGPGRDQTIVL